MAEKTGLGFSLNEFMSSNRDFSRGYTFYVRFDNVFGLDSDTTYLVRGSSLPASTIESATTSWQGNAYKVATTQTFEAFSVTFNVDPKDNIRNSFLKWAQKTHNAANNLHGTPNDYMKDITVEHVSHTDESIITAYKLIKAWPTTVGALELAYDNKEIAQLEVSFEYQFHTSAPGAAPDGGSIQHG